MTATSTPNPETLPIDKLFAYLSPHGPGQRAALQPLQDRGELSESQARRIAVRLAAAVGSSDVPTLKKRGAA